MSLPAFTNYSYSKLEKITAKQAKKIKKRIRFRIFLRGDILRV